MAIRLVVTRGYGNGTFDGTIADAVRRGYGGAAASTGGTRRQRQIKALIRARERRERKSE